LEVVCGDLRAWNEAAVLVRQRSLAAAVEEVRDVSVLLGLGDVELAPAGVARGMSQRADLLGPELRAFLRDEYLRWERVIKSAGI
jgi:hypothetical protein